MALGTGAASAYSHTSSCRFSRRPLVSSQVRAYIHLRSHSRMQKALHTRTRAQKARPPSLESSARARAKATRLPVNRYMRVQARRGKLATVSLSTARGSVFSGWLADDVAPALGYGSLAGTPPPPFLLALVRSLTRSYTRRVCMHTVRYMGIVAGSPSTCALA